MSIRCDEFVKDVELLIRAPVSASEQENILGLGTMVMRSVMVPMLEGVNQEFFTVKHSAISVKKDQTGYRIPIRSIGGSVRDVQVEDKDGKVSAMRFTNHDRGGLYSSEDSPYSFYFMGDRIELAGVPAFDDEYKIIFYYPASPGKLVMPSKAGQIDSVTDDQVSCLTLPPSFTVGRRYDFIRGTGTGWYAGLLAKSIGVAGSTVSFESGSTPKDLETGDWLALTGESPVIQLPIDLIPYMVSKTAEAYLGSLSDFEGKTRLQDDIRQKEAGALSLITPRNDGSPKLIVNRASHLRGRRSRNMGILWRD